MQRQMEVSGFAYELAAVVVHRGYGNNMGHLYTYKKSTCSSKWFLCNDRDVDLLDWSTVSRQVFAALRPDLFKDHIVSPQILMFRKARRLLSGPINMGTDLEINVEVSTAKAETFEAQSAAFVSFQSDQKRELEKFETEIVENVIALCSDGESKEKEKIVVRVSSYRYEIKLGDLERVLENKWLNCEVINGMSGLMQDLYGNSGVLVLTSYLWNGLFGFNKKYCFESVRKYIPKQIRKLNVSDRRTWIQFDRLLFPLNLMETHWAVLLMDVSKRELHLFDSKSQKQSAELVAKVFRRFTGDLIDTSQLELDIESWSFTEHSKDYAQQVGGSDCGVYSINCMRWLCAGYQPNFIQEGLSESEHAEQMRYYRERIVTELVHQRILSVCDTLRTR